MLSILIVAFAAAVLTVRPRQNIDISRFDAKAFNFELIDAEQNKTTLSDMKGSVVFVNFWATWCVSCVEELPSIESMHKNFSGNSSFRMVTIVYKDDVKRALSFMKKHGFTFPVYFNPDESAARIFGITGVPETFIIDKNGRIRHKVVGPAEWDSPRAFELVQELIRES